ncbi:MAG: aldehyde dehydrogenase (NADP(+)) [Planctomycetota bacterium]
MELHGQHLIGSTTSAEAEATFTATDPRTGTPLATTFRDATPAEVDRAFQLAAAAHPGFESRGRAVRAAFLEAIAVGIEALGDPLLERASAETGLPLARLTGERGRTCAQLRMFASLVRNGSHLDLRIDHADRERQPLPKPDLRSMQRALGPVCVFGASNFPLAFSVAGGDTASALAAGCPVVVKAHPNHPGTSEMVGRVVAEAVANAGLPKGTFSLLQGVGHDVGAEMVQHPAAKAVGFTGSFRGGRALFDLATQRREPIPVFAEMGSINPVFLLPDKLARAAVDLANGISASVTLGVGQFCTNPGVLVAVEGPGLDEFVATLADALQEVEETALLHHGIKVGYEAGLDRLCGLEGVDLVFRGSAERPCGARPCLATVPAKHFLDQPELHEEVFGPSTLLVVCRDRDELRAVARALDGQLTVTVQATDDELDLCRELLPVLEQKAGRVLFGGYPTGVEVCHAMVHGGPYPATTDSRSTSVGTGAIHRFTRPVAYQNMPEALLPEELRDAAPAGLGRLVDGEREG